LVIALESIESLDFFAQVQQHIKKLRQGPFGFGKFFHSGPGSTRINGNF
jgi:hypothetical protein